MTLEQLYTTQEVATALQLNEQTVMRFIREKRIKAKKVGNGYRITKEALEEYWKSL